MPALTSAPRELPVPAPTVPTDTQVRGVMRIWREAILFKNADDVLACDRTFRDNPTLFMPALHESAERDSEERVRAFSTRMLGKLRDPALAPAFRKLLGDSSPLVRGNAAWALGELRSREAAGELERLRRHDRDREVREAAEKALGQLAIAGRR